MPGPSYEEIVAYWSSKEDEGGLAVDWAEACERCWRCGYKSTLQRCHIHPGSLGGSSEVQNLVLLCGRCHREAPNVSDPRFMWIWLRATCVPFYDLYWTARGIQEFERMFGRKPFQGSEFKDSEVANAITILQEELQKAIVHFGEGRLNPSTIASVFALLEERITGRALSPLPSSSDQLYLLRALGIVR